MGKRAGRPFQDSYAINLTLAILALVPFIVITTAYALFRRHVEGDLGMSRNAASVVSALATAGYAFGALLGGDIIQRFAQRRLFFFCEALFAAGCAAAASAAGTVQFGAGMVLLAFATGLLLVVALPPVIRRFPPARMVITSGVVNLGFFGATAAGPLVGGAVAFGHAWRWLYGGLAAIGALQVALAWLTLPSQPPMQPGARIDTPALALAFAATALPFLASGELAAHSFDSYWFTVPLAVGAACFVAMLLTEYHQKNPLSPVKPMWHTIPLVGTMAAMFGGGAFVTFLVLAERYEVDVLRRSALATGLSFWPQLLGTVITAGLLMLLIRTRYLPVLVLSGMLTLIASGFLLLALIPGGSHASLLAAVGLLGLGAGATVSPGLWMAGFSLPSQMVGRTFALVELVRSEADFLLAPVLLEGAQVSSGDPLSAQGIRYGIWVAVLLTIATTAIMAALYLAGGVRLPKPDLQRWLKGTQPALDSPALLAAFRSNPKKPAEKG